MQTIGFASRPSRAVYPLGALMLALIAAAPARADFFDDMRQTFQTDVPHFFQNDVPHFFQDDIPCAFGGKPTSHTKASCKSDKHAPKPAAGADRQSGRAADEPSSGKSDDAPPNSYR